MQNNSDVALRHTIQTILQQMIDVNKNIENTKKNDELDEHEKNANVSFANYHLLVLSILLHDWIEKAKELFPDALPVIEWSEVNYKYGLDNNLFNPCKCNDCEVKLPNE